MSETTTLNHLPFSTSWDTLSVIVTDSDGNPKRVNNFLIVKFQNEYATDADSMLTSAGVLFCRTRETTLNLPEDCPTKWGILATFAIGGGPQIQKFLAYTVPYREYARSSDNTGLWRPWVQIIGPQ